MFTNNKFGKFDAVADAIKNIAEADYKAKMEELKGQQHKIDKNKNNKIDAHDFAILRGEKKGMKKEESEQIDEALPDIYSIKNTKTGQIYHNSKFPITQNTSVYKKIKAKGGEHIHATIHKNGKPVKEEVENVEESNNPFDLKNYKSQLPTKPGEKAGFDSKKISTGTVYSRKPVKDEPMKKEEIDPNDTTTDTLKGREKTSGNPFLSKKVKMDVPDNVKEEAEQIDELKKATVKSYLAKKMASLPGKDPKKDQKDMMKAHHRVTGVKPTSEEVEQVDEVYDIEHMKYINTKEGDKHFEDGHATMMKHIGDEFQKVNAKRYAHNAFKENPHKKGTKEHKAWHHGADAARDEHIGSLHEAAKWRSTSVAKKVTDPDDPQDSVAHDYHYDNPKSTGMKKATSDTPTKYGSLSARPNAQVASQGARKGMITKQHAERLKARIKANMNNEEVEQVDERTLTKGETKEKERIVKGMKKSLAGFKQRYGEKAKSVMYATATARAKKD